MAATAQHGSLRSIPACAGEPWRSGRTRPTSAVYPRVCGGTFGGFTDSRFRMGLSPRVRGNLIRWLPAGRRVGSIPACAGEPRSRLVVGDTLEVYPRVCGGTASMTSPHSLISGLSPRVRGNPCGRRSPRVPCGSIPACAGEPYRCRDARPKPTVYPRVCGGTSRRELPPPLHTGLSPRVRGNPFWN